MPWDILVIVAVILGLGLVIAWSIQEIIQWIIAESKKP